MGGDMKGLLNVQKVVVCDNETAQKAVDEATKTEEALKKYGNGAKIVTPYKPNRKQRRAQQARARKEKK